MVQGPDISFVNDVAVLETYSAKLRWQLFKHIDIYDIVAIIFDPIDDQITRVDLVNQLCRRRKMETTPDTSLSS